MKLSGNEKFDSIYKESRDRVYRTALYYMHSHEIAEEILQDTFLELYIRIDSINHATAENWLLKVARNKCVNWLKRAANEAGKLESLEMLDTELVTRNLEDSILENERKRKFGQLSQEIFTDLKSENTRWYEAVTEVYCLGKPQKEVAKEMDIRIEVLHAILYRARKWIKRHYKTEYKSMFEAEE